MTWRQLIDDDDVALTPAADKIPLADSSGKLHGDWLPISAEGQLLYGVDSDGSVGTLAAGSDKTVLRCLSAVEGKLAWGKVDLTSDVAGTLPASSGGTGQTTVAAAIDAANGSRCLASVLDAAEVANTVSETDMLNVSLSANTMGARSFLEVTIEGFIYNQSGANIDYTPRVKFGGTTLWGDVFSIAGNSVRKPFAITFRLGNLNATNKQALHGVVHLHNATANGSVAGIGNWGAASEQINRFSHNSASYPAIDTTATQSLVVTMTMGTAHANGRFKIDHATVELRQAA